MIRSLGMIGGGVLALAVVVGLTMSHGPVQANDVSPMVGKKAPAFENLPGVDDQTHSLADYKDAKATVVIFTCNHCPVAVAYEDRFIEFVDRYKEKGVKLVAINVNTGPADRLPAMKQRAEQKGFNFPYIYDESQQIARDYTAKVTPELFVLDADGKIVYHGAFDDSQNASNVKETYVADAVDAVLAGKSVDKPSTRARGCGIKYNN